jgi:hypothetical protein
MRTFLGALIGIVAGCIAGSLLGYVPTLGTYYLVDPEANPGPHGTGMAVVLVGMVCMGGGIIVGSIAGGVIGGVLGSRRRPDKSVGRR